MPIDHREFRIVKLVDAATPQTFDDLVVDPTNPNVELRPMVTPGPDDNVGLPAVQTDYGEATMAQKDWIIVESYSSGNSQTGDVDGRDFLLWQRGNSSVETGSDDRYLLTAIRHAGQTEASIPEKRDEVLIGFEFGDGAPKGSTTPGALLFNFSSEPNTAEGGVPKGNWITDVTYGSVDVLGQPTVAIEALTIAHDGPLI